MFLYSIILFIGWFDHWYEDHHAYSAKETADRVKTILGPEFNASINFYMFTGGTNFAFYNGANNGSKYAPTVTSYDYDAPISESGDVTMKYRAIRDVIMKLGLGPEEWPSIPANSPKTSYGEIQLTHVLDFEELVKISNRLYGSISYEYPRCMESLEYNDGFGQPYGWLLYRATFRTGKSIKIEGAIMDRANIYVNKKQIGVYAWNKPVYSFTIDAAHLNSDGNNELEILVENLGRVNFRRAEDDPRLLENQIKGIHGQIYVDGNLVTNWLHVPLDFEYDFREALTGSTSWITYHGAAKNTYPTVLKAYFSIVDSDPMDTFIDMGSSSSGSSSQWQKGIVLVNGFNIGRYWSVGPQLSLYVPAPLLRRGRNEVIVFELEQAAASVTFSAEPRLG